MCAALYAHMRHHIKRNHIHDTIVKLSIGWPSIVNCILTTAAFEAHVNAHNEYRYKYAHRSNEEICEIHFTLRILVT